MFQRVSLKSWIPIEIVAFTGQLNQLQLSLNCVTAPLNQAADIIEVSLLNFVSHSPLNQTA